jgi:hypothetical protein
MSAPTVTWYPFTDNGSGSSVAGSAISVIDFGSVQAGYWSDVKCVRALFSGNTANTLKFWLNDTVATNSSASVSVSASATAPWKHYYAIASGWFNPASVTDAMKAGGTNTLQNGVNFTALPESEPSSSNFVTTTIASAGTYTDYIYLCLQPPSSAADGLTSDFGYRLSFLYP